MNPLNPFRLFAYEDMLPMAPASRHPSITTTSNNVTSHLSCATVTSIRRASRTATESNTSSRTASPTNTEHSASATTSNGAASLDDSQYSPTTAQRADAPSPTDTRRLARVATSDHTASFTNTEHPPTATASNYAASSTETCRVTPPLSASKAPTRGRPNYKTNNSFEPTAFGMQHLLNIPAVDILTALIKRQVNLPTKEVILATGNPLGMMIPTKKRFILVDGRIRHGRVVEGRVVQVTSEEFEKYMATEYQKAFENEAEELEYPLTEPLTRTRRPDAPRPTLKEIRVAVAKQVQQAVESEVEGLVAKLVEAAETSVVEGMELEIETIVAELVEEAVAIPVERPIGTGEWFEA